jgi:O-acetyl-ADP-ribose deacetylase (regulator of RNase III)
MTILNEYILATAFGCLLIGLGLYLTLVRRKQGNEYFHTTNLICWLLIALFPALVIFSFFPSTSSASGNIFGFSVGGAVALFVFIWWFGTQASMKASSADLLNGEISDLKSKLEKAQSVVDAKTPEASAPITETKIITYRLKAAHQKKIALITGNILGVTKADIWVNSENTQMQMSRFFEKSISGTIRYLGARRDDVGDVVEDVIMAELSKLMSGKVSVQPASVLVTGSGELRRSHNVKKIFHAAAVVGEIGVGYKPIGNIDYCVRNALQKADQAKDENDPCKSILFPLFGTGQARENAEAVATRLLNAACEYLEGHPESVINTVYFLTYTDRDLTICKNALEAIGRVEVD